MATTALQIAITDPTVSFDQWTARLHRLATGDVLATAHALSEGSTPVDILLDDGGDVTAVYVTLMPRIQSEWKPGLFSRTTGYYVPSGEEAPFLFAASWDNPPDDPLDEYVAFFAPLHTDLLDAKGHTVSAGVDADLIQAPFEAIEDSDGFMYSGGPATNATAGLYSTSNDFNGYEKDFCLEFWLTGGEPQNVVTDIFSWCNADQTKGIWMQRLADGGLGRIQVIDMGYHDFDWPALDVCHFAITSNHARLNIYVNGFSIAQMAGRPNLPDTNRLYIGRGFNDAGYHHAGMLGRFKLTLNDRRYHQAFTPPYLTLTVPPYTGNTEPDWPTTVGATVIEDDIIWTNAGRMIQPITHGWFNGNDPAP